MLNLLGKSISIGGVKPHKFQFNLSPPLFLPLVDLWVFLVIMVVASACWWCEGNNCGFGGDGCCGFCGWW